MIVASVIPSAAWRVAVGLGVDLGWSAEQLDKQHIPGSGTAYVIVLSALSIAFAVACLLLVPADGVTFPRWVPIVGGRRPPTVVVAVVGFTASALLTWICVMSIVNWDRVSGFADRPDSGWARLMAACYAPALLWPPLVLALTIDHVRRRGANSSSARRAGEDG